MAKSFKSHVQSLQTVVPTKPTDPRRTRRIITPQFNPSFLQRSFHVILCYSKDSAEESGWMVAGRMKESLGMALEEEPLLAGRLRQGGAEAEICSNDSGVRLVEARVDVMLEDIALGEGEGKAELAFWEDVVDHNNPQFCPLFYVQVTNFSCGGYSIGISCSLLLVDPFVLTTFLKKWAYAHASMMSKTDTPKTPIFYLPHFGKPESSPSLLMGTNTIKTTADGFIFKIPVDIPRTNKNLAAVCVGEAERQAGRKMAPSLSVFIGLEDDAEVEICSREGLLDHIGATQPDKIDGLTCERTTWNELGLDGLCFNRSGEKPVYVSCWINSVADEGFVMLVPSSDGVKIVVTFAN